MVPTTGSLQSVQSHEPVPGGILEAPSPITELSEQGRPAPSNWTALTYNAPALLENGPAAEEIDTSSNGDEGEQDVKRQRVDDEYEIALAVVETPRSYVKLLSRRSMKNGRRPYERSCALTFVIIPGISCKNLKELR